MVTRSEVAVMQRAEVNTDYQYQGPSHLYYTQYTPPFGTFLCGKSKAPLLSQRRWALEYISG